MTPQVPDNDSATQQGASGGFENLMLMMPGETTPVGRSMRLKGIKQLLMQKDPEGDDKEDEKENGVPDLQEDEKEEEVPDLQIRVRVSDKLFSEFEHNDRIIFNL